MADLKKSLDWYIASLVFEAHGSDQITKAAVELIREERAACVRIAAEYGGRDSADIAERIGMRNFKTADQ